MTDGPSVRRIKSEKRNMPVEPTPAGMSRRRFLTFVGTGSAALAARSVGLLPEPEGIPKGRGPRRASGQLAEHIRAP
jgi:hypothetical protein